jgi:coproporphyrinogen III oxidase
MGTTTRSTSHPEDSDVDGIINDVLDKQQLTFENMLAVQQKAFQACLKAFVEANNKRVDELVREHARNFLVY